MNKTKLAKAISMAVAGVALSVAASTASAHVSYNYNSSLANNNATGPWTGGGPTGYTGNLPVTWIANVHNDANPNTSYTVSTADAIAEHAALPVGTPSLPAGFAVSSLNNKWNPLHSWGNALDFGLINMHAAGNLLIRVEADASTGSIFTPGFTLFSGWDSSPTSSKHGAWNVALPAVPVNPRGSVGLTYLGQASTTVAGGFAEYLFTGLAAGHYSLWIGGNNTGPGIGGATAIGATGTTNQTYVATITTSAVPVPGAVWLFGSAMAGLIGFGRRKAAVAV